MMGMFDLFIVLPQIVASSLLGWVLKNYLHSEPMNALVLGGVSMGLAALLTLLVVTFKQTGGESRARGRLARFALKAGLFRHHPVVNPPLEPVQMEAGQAVRRRDRDPVNAHRLEAFGHSIPDFRVNRPVGEVDDDHELVLVVRAHEGDHVSFIGIAQPGHAAVPETGVLFPQPDQVPVNFRNGGRSFGCQKIVSLSNSAGSPDSVASPTSMPL